MYPFGSNNRSMYCGDGGLMGAARGVCKQDAEDPVCA